MSINLKSYYFLLITLNLNKLPKVDLFTKNKKASNLIKSLMLFGNDIVYR
jgi:hypothetical protein